MLPTPAEVLGVMAALVTNRATEVKPAASCPSLGLATYIKRSQKTILFDANCKFSLTILRTCLFSFQTSHFSNLSS